MFNLSSKVIITDPCYEKEGTWCNGVLEKVKVGQWYSEVDRVIDSFDIKRDIEFISNRLEQEKNILKNIEIVKNKYNLELIENTIDNIEKNQYKIGNVLNEKYKELDDKLILKYPQYEKNQLFSAYQDREKKYNNNENDDLSELYKECKFIKNVYSFKQDLEMEDRNIREAYKDVINFDTDKLSRISVLKCFHKDISLNEQSNLKWTKTKIVVGVDSGQAGVFDYNKYPKDGQEDEKFYSECCDLTLSSKSFGNIEFGCVSSSGYGDGSYQCYISKNKDKEIIGIKLIYISKKTMEKETNISLNLLNEFYKKYELNVPSNFPSIIN